MSDNNGSSWGSYRANNPNSWLTMKLDNIPGLQGFWIKVRKVGSYTSKELSDGQAKWSKVRMAYITRKVIAQTALATAEQKDEYATKVEEALNLVEGGVLDAEFLSDEQRQLLGYLMQETSIAKLQPLVGIDIEILEEWNLTHPVTNEPLKVPKEDFSVIETLPLEVLWAIKEKLVEAQEGLVPPKVRKMLSM